LSNNRIFFQEIINPFHGKKRETPKVRHDFILNFQGAAYPLNQSMNRSAFSMEAIASPPTNNRILLLTGEKGHTKLSLSAFEQIRRILTSVPFFERTRPPRQGESPQERELSRLTQE
jgi:hypothetical protein